MYYRRKVLARKKFRKEFLYEIDDEHNKYLKKKKRLSKNFEWGGLNIKNPLVYIRLINVKWFKETLGSTERGFWGFKLFEFS